MDRADPISLSVPGFVHRSSPVGGSCSATLDYETLLYENNEIDPECNHFVESRFSWIAKHVVSM